MQTSGIIWFKDGGKSNQTYLKLLWWVIQSRVQHKWPLSELQDEKLTLNNLHVTKSETENQPGHLGEIPSSE